MKGVQYIRVSDEEQAVEGFSIQAQKALLDRKFEEWGMVCVGVYIDDGYTAKNINRPDLQRLIHELPTTKPDVIAFWKIDRWTRQTRDWHELKALTKGTKLRSAVGENTDEGTAFNRFNVGLNVLLGQFERDQISERVHFVMMERHLKGLRNGSKAPYGYKLVEGKLHVVPEESEVVKKIFEMYQSMNGFRTIAMKLNESGSHRWSYSTVRYVLTNPIYAGKLRWNHRSGGKVDGKDIISDGDHEPIIPVEVFEKVNSEINSRTIGGRTIVYEHVFSGVLRCARCGSSMIGFTANKNSHYRCVRRVNYGDCKQPVINATRLEEAFLSALNIDSEQIRKYLDVDIDTDANKLKSLESELEQLKKRKKRWQIAYADEVITLEEYKERVKEDEERQKQITQDIQSLKNPKTIDKKQVIDSLIQLKELWGYAENKEKKMFVRELFKTIAVMATANPKPSRGKYASIAITDVELT